MERIRLAKLSDAEVIQNIYKPYVLESPISFEIIPPSSDEMKSRISDTLEKFPWLVYEHDNVVVGYAYASPYKSRCAYSWSAESTVYIREGYHGKGIGKALYTSLLSQLKNQGVVNVIGGISLPNAASVRLHESLGFTQVATFKDVGFKFKKWWDVGYWQLQFQKPIEPQLLKPQSFTAR